MAGRKRSEANYAFYGVVLEETGNAGRQKIGREHNNRVESPQMPFRRQEQAAQSLLLLV